MLDFEFIDTEFNLEMDNPLPKLKKLADISTFPIY